MHYHSFRSSVAAAAADHGDVVNVDDDSDVTEAVCWSDSVCIHVHTRSSSLGISAVLGSGFLHRRSGANSAALSPTVRVNQRGSNALGSRHQCDIRQYTYVLSAFMNFAN